MKSRWYLGGAAALAVLINSSATAQGLGGTGGATPPATPPTTDTSRAGLQSAFAPPPPIRLGQPVSLLVFPFGYAESGAPPADPSATEGSQLTPEQREVGGFLTAAVKAGFLATPAFSVASYSPTSALILRARKDDILRAEHTTGLVNPANGQVDVTKARTVAYRLGFQAILIGSIDLKADSKANTAEITLDAQILNSTTGEAMRPTAVVAGAAQGTAGVPWLAVAERAAQDAAAKALPALGIELVAPPSGTPKEQKAAAERAARAQREAAEKAKKEQERAAKEAARKAKQQNSGRNRGSSLNDVKPGVPAIAESLIATEAPLLVSLQGAPATGARAGTAPPVKAVANAAGGPDPYGYAVDGSGTERKRNRLGIRVHPWLGIAAFLTGVMFLLP